MRTYGMSIMSRVAICALLAVVPAASQAQDVVMRRPAPGPKPDSLAVIAPILPQDPRDAVAACDPATQDCVANDAVYSYAWFAGCQTKPPTLQCVRFDGSSLTVGTEAECASAKPTSGLLEQYLTIVNGFSSGSKPTTVQLYAKCGVRDVYDKGWSVDCASGATAVCVGMNTYTGLSQQYPDSDCQTAATAEQATYAKIVGLVPTGEKPDTARMCGTKAVPAQFNGWRVYNSASDTAGTAPLGDPFVCATRAGRVIQMSCAYKGGAIAADSRDCDYQTDEFIAKQAGMSQGQLTNLGGGQVLETRWHGYDPLLFGSCNWVPSVDADYPDGACTTTNYQGQEGGQYTLGTGSFYNKQCGPVELYLTEAGARFENIHWVNFLGDTSSGVNGARSYCEADGGPDDNYDVWYISIRTPNACGNVPNTKGPNYGQ